MRDERKTVKGGLDRDECRKARQNQKVELRKAKKDDVMQKRRNMFVQPEGADDAEVPLPESSDLPTFVATLNGHIQSGCPEETAQSTYLAVKGLRKLLSIEVRLPPPRLPAPCALAHSALSSQRRGAAASRMCTHAHSPSLRRRHRRPLVAGQPSDRCGDCCRPRARLCLHARQQLTADVFRCARAPRSAARDAPRALLRTACPRASRRPLDARAPACLFCAPLDALRAVPPQRPPGA